MPRYIRSREDSIFFFTVVTHERRPLIDDACVDYVHVNPLKHGPVERVIDWPWSSFHRYVKQGLYPPDWGSANEWYGDEFANAE